jgi:hypothetical protein
MKRLPAEFQTPTASGCTGILAPVPSAADTLNSPRELSADSSHSLLTPIPK